MRIDYDWYWIIWDNENKEWIFEWKSEEKRKECNDRRNKKEMAQALKDS